MSIRTAVIPVAGLGTRFLPITKVVAKELLPLVDTPTIQYIIEEVRGSGVENIILINSRGKSAIEDYFDYELDELRYQHKKDKLEYSHDLAKKINIISIRQHKAMGLGHAIYCARHAIKDEPFAVLLGDDVIDGDPPCLKQLIDLHNAKGGAPVVGVMEVAKEETSKYGIVGGEKEGDSIVKVDSLVEKPDPDKAPSQLAIPGRYILTPEIFSILKETKPSVGGEIQLTDALLSLAKRRPMYALKFQGTRYDAGDKLGFIEANIHFAMKREEFREPLTKMIKDLANKL